MYVSDFHTLKVNQMMTFCKLFQGQPLFLSLRVTYLLTYLAVYLFQAVELTHNRETVKIIYFMLKLYSMLKFCKLVMIVRAVDILAVTKCHFSVEQ